MKHSCGIFGVSRGYEVADYDKRFAQLKVEVNRLIEDGVTQFITSGNIGYEMDIAEYIIDLKQSNNNIKLIITQPYEGKSVYFRFRGAYDHMMRGADEVKYFSEYPRNEASKKQAEWIVNQCDVLIGITNTESTKIRRWSKYDLGGKTIIELPYNIDNFIIPQGMENKKYSQPIDTPNNRKRWTAEEEAKLVNEYRQGMSILDMAKAHGRSERAIQGQLKRAGVFGTYGANL